MTTATLQNAATRDAINKAIDATMSATIELTKVQNEILSTFKAKESGILKQKSIVEDARKAAHKAVDAEFNSQVKAMDKQRAKLKTEYSEQLIDAGLKEGKQVITESPAVKIVDNVTKRGLGLFGKAARYVSSAVKEGADK
jgi:primosomal protein N'